MCNAIRYLAELDHFRFIAICEHEMLHLGWDHALFYLSPAVFASLQEILAEVDATGHDIESSGGIYWLHLYDYALRLAPRDLQELARLVQLASQELPEEVSDGDLDTELELIWESAALAAETFVEPDAPLFSLN